MSAGPASQPPVRPAPDRHAGALLALALCILFAWLLQRSLGLYPGIFADEWYYSKMARLMPLGEAMVPSYLYLWLFGFTSSCGAGFLDCVRIGNALLLVGAAPFLYLIACQVMRPALAVVVTLMCLLAPVNLYSAMFMPETAYYFGFAVLSWLLLTRVHWRLPALAAGAGLVLGMMSLVKVHALFLLPAVSLFLIGAGWLQAPRGRWLRDGLAGTLLLVGAALAAKLGLGYLLAGEPALGILGSFYGHTASANAGKSLATLASAAFINGRGHLMALAVLLPLPMAILLLLAIGRRTRQALPPALARLALYAVLTLGAAAGVTVLFTASLAGITPLEVLRLHLRYYSFAFPLLFILAAAAVGAHAALGAERRLRLVAALLVGSAVVAAKFLLPLYVITDIDGPELAAIGIAGWTGWAIVALDLLVLGAWAAGSRLAAPLFLFVALPAMLALGIQASSHYFDRLRAGWPADRGGIAARDHVPRDERKLITVVSDSVTDAMRAQLHIDDKDTGMLVLADGAPIEPYHLPARRRWMLVMGEHALPDGLAPVLSGDGFRLVRLAGSFRPLASARLSTDIGPGKLVQRAEGLSKSEPWGRWSDAGQVVLHFDRPLPKRLVVLLTALAYADNTTLPFTMRVGDAASSFLLGGSEQEVTLRFETDGAQRSLTIEVPRPTAPSSLGQWPDDRLLGIGIAEIAIGAAPDDTTTSFHPDQ
jgi:phosphoglycerol transferase